MKEVIYIESFIDLEREYMKQHNLYFIEDEIIKSFSEYELKNFIKDTQEEYMKEKLTYNYTIWRRKDKGNLSIMDKCFIEQIAYVFEGWKELELNKKFIDKLKRNYKLNYENNNSKTYKKVDIKSIHIREVISKYINISDNLRRNIKCCFHNDKSPSMKIYEWNNSWYCFGCQRWGWIVEFVSEIEKCTKKEAFKKIIKIYSNY